MKIKYTLVFLLIYLVFPFSVDALSISCYDEAFIRLKKIASNIQMTYSTVDKNDTVSFNVRFTNMHEDLYVFDVLNDKKYNYTEQTMYINDLKPDKNYQFQIRTDKYGCDSDVIHTFYLSTPPYNKYYKDSVCEGLTNYNLCQKWNKNLLTYDEFVRTITIYKNSLKQDVIIEDENEKTILEKFLDTYANYYYILFPLIIITGGTIIYLNDKKNSFDF